MTALVSKYILFAVIATGVNLSTQWLVLLVAANDLWLLLALMAGTGPGLVAK